MARLLVVEDHADVRAMLGEHLAAQGHQVESCGDGRRAVDLVRAETAAIAARMPASDSDAAGATGGFAAGAAAQ